MELDQITAGLADYSKLKDSIIATKKSRDYDLYKKQWDTKQHDIMDNGLHPDKVLDTDQGGGTILINRVPVSFQQTIVSMAATFLCGNKVKVGAKPLVQVEKDLQAVVQKTLDDNKMDYNNLIIVETLGKESDCAEIWYPEKVEDDYWDGTPNKGAALRFRYMLLSNENGDSLYPVFNSRRDLIAIGRGYSVKNGETNEDHFDLYTATASYLAFKTQEGWAVTKEANLIGKIQIIYYDQTVPEWWYQQEACDRYDGSLSKHGDDNDYFGSPMVVVEDGGNGGVKGFAKKGESGKFLELQQGAKVSYLESKTAAESIELERKDLRSVIYDTSHTPDISLEQMKNLGVLSGAALKTLFMRPHMKAAKKETIVGMCFRRRINYLKAAMITINPKLKTAKNLDIKPVFEYYLPKDDESIVNMLAVSTNSQATMSQKTAVSINPLVTDPEAELADIEKEGLNNAMNDDVPPAPKPVPKSAPAPASAN